jgi:hypothetical protein
MNNLFKKLTILITILLNLNYIINSNKYKNFNRNIIHLKRYGIPSKLISRIKNKRNINKKLTRPYKYRRSKNINKKTTKNNIKINTIKTVELKINPYSSQKKEFHGNLNEIIQISWYLSENYRHILELFKNFFLKNIDTEFKKKFYENKKKYIANLIAYKEIIKNDGTIENQLKLPFEEISILKDKEEQEYLLFLEEIQNEEIINLSNNSIISIPMGDRFTLKIIYPDGKKMNKTEYIKNKNFFIFDDNFFEILLLCNEILRNIQIKNEEPSNDLFSEKLESIIKNFISEYDIFTITNKYTINDQKKNYSNEANLDYKSDEPEIENNAKQKLITKINQKYLMQILSLSNKTLGYILNLVKEKKEILNSTSPYEWRKWLKIGAGAAAGIGAGLITWYYGGPILKTINDYIPKIMESVKNFKQHFFQKPAFDKNGRYSGQKEMNWGEKIITTLNWPYSNLLNMFCRKAMYLSNPMEESFKRGSETTTSFKNSALSFAISQVKNTAEFAMTGSLSSFIPENLQQNKPARFLARTADFFSGQFSIFESIKNKLDNITGNRLSKALDFTSVFGIAKKISAPIFKKKIIVPFRKTDITQHSMAETAIINRINEMLHGSDAISLGARNGFGVVNTVLNIGNSYIQTGNINPFQAIGAALNFIPKSINPLNKIPTAKTLLSIASTSL